MKKARALDWNDQMAPESKRARHRFADREVRVPCIACLTLLATDRSSTLPAFASLLSQSSLYTVKLEPDDHQVKGEPLTSDGEELVDHPLTSLLVHIYRSNRSNILAWSADPAAAKATTKEANSKAISSSYAIVSFEFGACLQPQSVLTSLVFLEAF